MNNRKIAFTAAFAIVSSGLALALVAGGCNDGVTPDCSKPEDQCGPSNLDASSTSDGGEGGATTDGTTSTGADATTSPAVDAGSAPADAATD